MLNKFEHNKKYRVAKAWSNPPSDERFRMKQLRYELSVDEMLRFRGKNLGKAEFLDETGKLVILEPKVAFKIMSA
jgi:hypothetical protein